MAALNAGLFDRRIVLTNFRKIILFKTIVLCSSLNLRLCFIRCMYFQRMLQNGATMFLKTAMSKWY